MRSSARERRTSAAWMETRRSGRGWPWSASEKSERKVRETRAAMRERLDRFAGLSMRWSGDGRCSLHGHGTGTPPSELHRPAAFWMSGRSAAITGKRISPVGLLQLQAEGLGDHREDGADGLII